MVLAKLKDTPFEKYAAIMLGYIGRSKDGQRVNGSVLKACVADTIRDLGVKGDNADLVAKIITQLFYDVVAVAVLSGRPIYLGRMGTLTTMVSENRTRYDVNSRGLRSTSYAYGRFTPQPKFRRQLNAMFGFDTESAPTVGKKKSKVMSLLAAPSKKARRVQAA